MKYGRVDVSVPDECPEEGRLPGKYYQFESFLVINVFHKLNAC